PNTTADNSSPVSDASLNPSAAPSAPSTPLSPLSGSALDESYNLAKPLSTEINQFTGGLTYPYPIAIPPGRSNLQPDVKLTYSTDDTDPPSILGKGWSISIPYIQREAKYGVD